MQIGAPVHPPARRLLRRHVAGRPDRRTGLRERGLPCAFHPGDSEIGEQGPAAVLVEQDVGRLHVAVYDAAPVGVPERVGDLSHHAEDLVRRDARIAAEALLEGVAPHERHDEEADPLARIEVVDPHDVGVV